MHKTLLAVAGAALFAIAGAAAAQTPKGYPDRPIRVIVPVAPGGSTDFLARLVAQRLAETSGVPFVVDNRPGAGALIGSELVAKSQPDGHTLLFAYAAHTIAPFVYSKVPYDVERDFAPVTMVASQPLLLTVHPTVKANSPQDLIALAKAKPGGLNVALMTPTSSGALATEVFKILTNTQMVSVPFKGGGPAIVALLQGDVQLVFATPPDVMGHIKSGRLRVIGTSTRERLPYLPDAPTFAEAGVKDFNTAPWYGMLAPAKTPAAVIDWLYKDISDYLKTPQARERFASAGTDIVGNTPKEFGEHIRRELAVNAKVIKAVGMKAN